MPHRKDLGSQGRRPNRRRAIHLTEFLRGDNERTPREPIRQNESQNQNISSSIGDFGDSGATVSPVVSPITSSDEQEKVTRASQAFPPLVVTPPPQVAEVNAWDVLSGENVQTDDPYLQDHQEFPDLGSQAKRVKPKNATNPLNSATQGGLVLGNFLPEFLQKEQAAWKDNAMTICLSSVEDNSPGIKLLHPLHSAPRNHILRKRTASFAGPSHHQKSLQTQINPDKPAVPASLAEQQQQQERPDTSSQQQHQKMSATRFTEQIEYADEENVIPKSQFSVHPFSYYQSFWEEDDEQSPPQTGEEHVLTQPSNPLTLRSTLNANAQEFRPRARREQHQYLPGEFYEQDEPMNPEMDILFHRVRLSRRRRRQRFIRSLKVDEPQQQAANEGTQQATNEWLQQAANEMPQQLHERYEYEQRGGVTQRLPTIQMPIMEQNNSVVSQSVFRLASLPSTGVGTTVNSSSTSSSILLTDISSTNPLPSSISGLTSQGEVDTGAEMDVVGSPVSRRHVTIISQDLLQLYDRPLLDMDRKDTQEEEEEPEPEPEPEPGKIQHWALQQSEKELEPPSAHPDHRNPAEADNDAIVVCLDRNMMRTLFRAPAKHGKSYPQPDLNCVPAAIKKLHRIIALQYSDYSFVYALSGQLGQDCVPMECYVYLKMILLASLVSIEPDELRPPISLCIIATDSLIANRLMNSIGQLAPRFLGPHEYGLHPTILGGPLSSRYNWVVASPLLLAQQGVYYAGDWTRLSKEHGEQIEKCIENGAVPVPQLQTDQALEAAIWTHWQPENSNNQSLALAKLCPIFGLPIYMGEEQSSGDSDSLWNFLLRQHTKEGQSDKDDQQQHQDGLHIPEEDMRLLLHLLHQRKVTFEDRAQHMLQKYYVIARKERPTVFTSKTYIVLKQFAESFAKLALRLQVLESDVCLAIFHCEHFTQQIFGGISDKDLTAMPPPVVNSFRVISHIDPYMNEFARWLMQYLDRYDENELGMHQAKRRRTDSWGFP